jgi:hypothetical protein
MRLDFFLEEPLDPGGVLGRAAVSERAPDLRGDVCRFRPGRWHKVQN